MRGRVADRTARRLDLILAREQASSRMPSLVAGVVRDGELCWSGVRGDVGRPGGGAPSAERTQYRIGSITKTMTTVLVLQLRDEGALALDDQLGSHLPGAAYADRTLRELLSHASGMPAEPPGSWWERSPGVDFAELAARIEAGADALPRGQQYHYSNLGFGLLGEVVARLRGKPWGEVLQERLLRPLGMAATSYAPGPDAAQGYSVHAWSGALTAEPHQDTGAMAAAGQVWSTVADLARFAAFLGEPDPEVLAASSVDELGVPRSGSPDGVGAGAYGLGARLTVTADGRSLLGHTGSMPGFLAGLFVDRERRVGAVCLANGTSGLRCEGLPIDLLQGLEEEEPTLPPVWRPTESLEPRIAEILGVWHWGETALVLRWDADRLALSPLDGSRPMHYRPGGPDVFTGVSGYHTGETLRVVRRPDGSVGHLECATFVYTRTPYDPEAPVPGGHPER